MNVAPRQLTLSGIIGDIDVYSIGYGGRTLPELEQILTARGVDKLVDVRSRPHTTWMGKSFLEERLGNKYISITILGGMEYSTHQYREWRAKVPTDTLDGLVKLAEDHTVCLLCAEKDPVKCHRSYFVGRVLREEYGIEVQHL
jgi:uncharacterized protein (DUF488 family)